MHYGPPHIVGFRFLLSLPQGAQTCAQRTQS